MRVLTALCTAMIASAQVGPGEIQVRVEAYKPRTQYTLRVDTALVEVDAVVRDDRGRPIAGLTRGDFEITDQGKKREITSFTVLTAPPPSRASTPSIAAAPPSDPQSPPPAPPARFIGLVFDDMSMNGAELFQAKSGGKRFLSDGMSPGDKVAIFAVSSGQVNPFTSDKEKLAAAIDRVAAHGRSPDPGLCPKLTTYDAYLIANNQDRDSLEIKAAEAMRCSGESPRTRGATPNIPPRYYQMVQGMANANWALVRVNSLGVLESMEQIVDFMSTLSGKRVLLLASSGFLAYTLEPEQDRVIRHALRGGVVINALDAKGLFTSPPVESTPGGDARSATRTALLGTRPLDSANEPVATLAYGTGGLFFHNRNDLERGFQELGMIPETSYLMGFAPGAPDGKYHKLKVRAGNHPNVQARPGYLAATDSEPAPPAERPLDRAVMDNASREEIAVSAVSRVGKTETGEIVVQSVYHLDIEKLPYNRVNGTRNLKLRVISALFNAEGGFAGGKEGEVTLALKDDTFEKLRTDGVNASLSIPVAAGKYRLRTVVEDVAAGKLMAASQMVEVP
jgi:VWFA-related protein